MNSPNVARIVAFVSTIALSWAALTVGTSVNQPGLVAGEVADREYLAERAGSVLNVEEFELAQERAATDIDPVLMVSEQVQDTVVEAIQSLFAAVSAGVPGSRGPIATIDPTPLDEPIDSDPSTTTSSSTTTQAGAEPVTTTTTAPVVPVEPATVTGLIFLDAEGDGIFAPDPLVPVTDSPLGGIQIVARAGDGSSVTFAESASDGTFEIETPAGESEIGPNPATIANFDGLTFSAGFGISVVDCAAGETCAIPSIGLAPLITPIDIQVADLESEYAILDDETIRTLVMIASQDEARSALGRPRQLDMVARETEDEMFLLFRNQISDATELRQVKTDILQRPPTVTVDNLVNPAAASAVADVLVNQVAINMVIDADETERRREEARAAVAQDDFLVAFAEGESIVKENERLSPLQIDAINQLGFATARTVRTAAIAVALTVLVSTLGYYLSRFRPQFWHVPRMVALLGVLIVLASGSVRLTLEFQEGSSVYILPAVAFGYLAAVLFDNRMATLMALTVGVLAAIGTRDPGVITYGVLATLAPIGFVSRVSSRRAFRNSVAKTALATSVVAASCAWLFSVVPDASDQLTQVLEATAWAAGASVVASLVALSIMPFFESAFDITTTLRLLELTDRNHEALQILQAKAFGTFNHSLMVGTLADAAARAIGANNLLARAAAYYHDLGKTENPMYFIENQFGTNNPHDELPPEQSAQIIRSHVIDGMALAEKHKIPSEVSEGILAHHGDAIMRFFYEKARQQYGDDHVDVDDYRHAGHKPKSREMAIVMMADSVEGACRAVFGDEEPTPEGIEKVVARIVDEKVGDGQLGESDLTLGELTTVKSAFIEALVGHYHQRIPYPNFPGS